MIQNISLDEINAISFQMFKECVDDEKTILKFIEKFNIEHKKNIYMNKNNQIFINNNNIWKKLDRNEFETNLINETILIILYLFEIYSDKLKIYYADNVIDEKKFKLLAMLSLK